MERKDWPFALLLGPVRERKEAGAREGGEAGRSCVAAEPNERGPTTFLSPCRGRSFFIPNGALIPADLMRRLLFLFCRAER